MAITAASTAPGWYGNSLLSVPAVQAAEPILQIYANARALRDRMILNKQVARTQEIVVAKVETRCFASVKKVTGGKTSLYNSKSSYLGFSCKKELHIVLECRNIDIVVIYGFIIVIFCRFYFII